MSSLQSDEIIRSLKKVISWDIIDKNGNLIHNHLSDGWDYGEGYPEPKFPSQEWWKNPEINWRPDCGFLVNDVFRGEKYYQIKDPEDDLETWWYLLNKQKEMDYLENLAEKHGHVRF